MNKCLFNKKNRQISFNEDLRHLGNAEFSLDNSILKMEDLSRNVINVHSFVFLPTGFNE